MANEQQKIEARFHKRRTFHLMWKQELHVVAMFANRSGRNEQSS